MSTDSYRETPVTRAELDSLHDRILQLETKVSERSIVSEKKSRRPTVLQSFLWSSLVTTVITLALGYVADVMPMSGLYIAINVLGAAVAVVSAIFAFISFLAGIERGGFRKEW